MKTNTKLDVEVVLSIFKEAHCASDMSGCYILADYSEAPYVIGKGRKPINAWRNAAKAIPKLFIAKAKPTRP